MRRWALLVLGASLIALAVLPVHAEAAASWVDPAFGTTPVTFDLGPGRDVARALAVQPDGKVVIVGAANTANEGGAAGMAVLRVGPDGRLDATFGDGGKVILRHDGRPAYAQAVALQADGKIVVAGYATVQGAFETNNAMAVVRLDANGGLDPTFNGGAMVVVDGFTRDSVASTVAVLPDGKLLIGGSGQTYGDPDHRVADFMIVRLTAGGLVDTSFGDTGLVLTDTGPWERRDGVSTLAVRPDGRIVAAGTTSTSSINPVPTAQVVIAQYLPSGALDRAFGTDGIAVDDHGNGGAGDAALKPDGALVVAGSREFRSGVRSQSVAVTQFAADGTPDRLFGQAGAVVTHAPVTPDGVGGAVFNGNSLGDAVAVDARGGLVVAGFAFGTTNLDLALVRYNASGGLDQSFGRAGWIKTDIAGQSDTLTAVGILPDGRIAAAGITALGSAEQIVFAVYPSSGGAAAVTGWGWNGVGQVGDGTTVERHAPATVASGSGIAAVAAGAFHSLALTDAGGVKAWGWNAVGQLGDGTNVDRHAPVAVAGLTRVSAIAAGYHHSLAVQGGQVKAWGWNAVGQLGDGTIVDRRQPVTVPGLDNVVAVAGGAYHSLALRSDGTVWAWGWNGVGQLGDDTTVDRLRPVQVPGLTDIVAVAAGAFHSVALGSDGWLWTWGWNGVGQLGDGTTSDWHRPHKVFLMGGVAVAAGAYHNVALGADGTVSAWGYNDHGQVGGSSAAVLRPTAVNGLPTANAVGAGGLHSLAVDVGGEVWGWGSNLIGQLGDATSTDRLSPVRTAGPAGRAAVAGGPYHSLAVGPETPSS